MRFSAALAFFALLFALAFVNTPHAQACDTGGQGGAPTFSVVQPQLQVQAYQAQAFVAAPVVTQRFVVRQHVAPVQAFAVQQYAAPVVAVQAVRQPRRQVTRQVTTQRTGGLFGR